MVSEAIDFDYLVQCKLVSEDKGTGIMGLARLAAVAQQGRRKPQVASRKGLIEFVFGGRDFIRGAHLAGPGRRTEIGHDLTVLRPVTAFPSERPGGM